MLQNGHLLGEVKITQSLRPQLLIGSAIAAGSFTLGLLLLIGLRVVPLRLMHEALDRASFLSAHDQLTGLPNRTLLADRLTQGLSTTSRPNGMQVAMFCLDLDRFKQVNDEHGHEAGDCVLREAARRIAEVTRTRADVVRRADAGDSPAVRLGGDEFVVLLPGADAEGAALVADRIRQSLLEPIAISPDVRLTITAAIGVALAAEPEEPHHLLRRADAAMYEDKRRRSRPAAAPE